MRWLFSFSFSFISLSLAAQHCPWDCSGMILFQTDVSQIKLESLNPVLVDSGYKPITDTIYGTSLNTSDECRFMSYDEFTKGRAKKTSLHHWYGFDTVYYFAKGYFITKFNFCKFNGQKLWLRYQDPYRRDLHHHYIEVPDSNRIHLHEFSRQIRERNSIAIVDAISNAILRLKCDKWMLRPDECD